MVNVQSLLLGMEIRLVEDKEKGFSGDKSSGESAMKVYSRRKNKPLCEPNEVFYVSSCFSKGFSLVA